MSRRDEIDILIAENKRRLHQLRVREARFGFNTPPEVLIEIEDVERVIVRLEQERVSLPDEPHLRSITDVDMSGTYGSSSFSSGESVPESGDRVKTKRVELRIEGEFAEFTSNRQQDIVGVLAALLRIDPASIQVLRVYQGSIIVVLEMPEVAADRLSEMATRRDPELVNLDITSVLTEPVEGQEAINTAQETAKTLVDTPNLDKPEPKRVSGLHE